MKKNVIRFAMAIVIIAIAVFVSNSEYRNNNQTAGGGISLKEMTDTSKCNVTMIGEANATTEQQLGQVTGIANYEHNYGWYYVAADLVGCVSTEYNVACPTCDVRLGANFNFGKVEIKSGTFARNSVKTTGFDPQFSNFTINSGENYTAANATQISIIANATKVYFGHKGSSFFKLNDGNYYAGGEQRIGNFTVAGGMDFAEVKSGYAAAKWNSKNNSFTITANNIGLDSKNYIISYNRSNIKVGKGFGMNIASALYKNSTKTGLHVVGGLHKGSATLFAQFGGYVSENVFKPVIGLGTNVKL
jgi:hypothetical protein